MTCFKMHKLVCLYNLALFFCGILKGEHRSSDCHNIISFPRIITNCDRKFRLYGLLKIWVCRFHQFIVFSDNYDTKGWIISTSNLLVVIDDKKRKIILKTYNFFVRWVLTSFRLKIHNLKYWTFILFFESYLTTSVIHNVFNIWTEVDRHIIQIRSFYHLI